MTTEELGKIKRLLDSSDFLAWSGTHGGLIRQEWESFGAEIPLSGWREGKDSSQRLQWLNGDKENPFPNPVARVVDWLDKFQPANGQRFEPAEYPNVCPSGGLPILQPDVALVH